jgi:hypothetical protein
MGIGKMRGKMNYKKYVICLLFILISLFGSLYPDTELKNDRILEFAFNRIKNLQLENREDYLFTTSRYYLKFKYLDNAMKLFHLISDDYSRYTILNDLICNEKMLLKAGIEKVQQMVRTIRDEHSQVTLLYYLTMFYLKKEDKKNALETLNKLRAMKDIIKTGSYWTPMDLVSPLEKLGLDEEAEYLLKDYESIAFDNGGDFFFMDKLVKKYFSLNRKNKTMEAVSKMKKYIDRMKDKPGKIERLIEFSQLLFNIEQFETAIKKVRQAFDTTIKIEDKDKRLKCFIELLKLAEQVFYDALFFNLPEFEEQLIKNVVYSPEEVKRYQWSDTYNKNVIKFLVRKGDYKKANEISSKLDSLNKKDDLPDDILYKDYFYYYLGRKYLETKEMQTRVLDIAGRIQETPLLKIGLFLGVAEAYDNSVYNEETIEIVNQASEVHIDGVWEKDEALGKTAMFCIKTGYYTKALETIERVAYHTNRSALIFEVAQAYIRERSTHAARQLIDKYEIDSDFKAYALSKIAAKLVMNSQEEEAETMFKKAIDLVMQSDVGDLELIFNDYYYARVHGRLVKYNAFENLNVVR